MPPDTQDKLLDAAEELFSEQGIPNTSLRAVTTRAGANIASVNYHFGSKEGLIRAVLARRLEPLNAERLDLLGRYEQEADSEGPGVEKVLHALIAPAFQLTEESNQRFASMLARLHFEQDEVIYQILIESFAPVLHRFGAALHRAVPELPIEQLYHRLLFAIGAMAMTVANNELPTRALESLPIELHPPDLETATHRLVTFLSSGFLAPAGP